MISERIKTLIDMTPSDIKGVFDIGSDHGYLLKGLHDKNNDLYLVGCENKKGPYSNLKNNCEKYGIKCLLSDGLNDYDSNCDLVVLAGMGFNNIKKIIEANIEKLNNIEYFLIDSHNMLKETRLFFSKIGYFIVAEKIIYENGIYYELILFKKGKMNYNEYELEFGPFLMKEKSQIFKDKYSQLILKLSDLIKNNSLDKAKIDFLKQKIELYKEMIL